MSESIIKKAFGAFLFILGFALFFGGLYLLPFGTDAYLWFFVTYVAHGNWLYGAIEANLAALGMIIIGFVALRSGGYDAPSMKKKGGK